MTRASVSLLGALAVGALAMPVARADDDAAPRAKALAAEALFQEGRSLLQAGKAEQACDKLQDSQDLDPATGTLMALAMCHEQIGKLASSWAEFTEVEKSSRRSGRTDRAEFSKQKAAELRARLSTLTIEVSDEAADIDGLDLRRDGVSLADELDGVPVPVDGGTILIEAHAPGYIPYRKSITIKREGEAAKLTIPALKPRAPRKATTPTPATSSSDEPSAYTPVGPPAPSGRGWGALEWSGVIGIGTGIAALGVGAYFLGGAFSKMNDSHATCFNDVCDAQGLSDRRDAVHRGNLASAFGAGGAALVVLGTSLFVVGRSRHREQAKRSTTWVGVAGDARGFEASLGGRF